MKNLIKQLLRENLELSSEKTFYDDGKSYDMDIRKDKFIHFTPKNNIDSIIGSKKLTSENSVFAISSVWGKFSKAVLPKDNNNLAAIYFTTDTIPKKGYPEEVLWKGSVNLLTVGEISLEEAMRTLNETYNKSFINTDDEVNYYDSRLRQHRIFMEMYDVPVDFLWEYREFDRCDEEDNIKGNDYINRLTDDIKANGIKQPITLQIYGGLALIDEGNHRLCIAKKLGLKTVPVKIISKSFGSINKNKAKPINYNRDTWRFKFGH